MARNFKQFRYYKDGSSKNIPANFSKFTIALEDFINSDTGKSYFPIYKLGIQTLPGVKFYLNDKQRLNKGVVINNTGIFELDLKDKVEIDSLIFDPISLKTIGENENAYLLVDIIYEE